MTRSIRPVAALCCFAALSCLAFVPHATAMDHARGARRVKITQQQRDRYTGPIAEQLTAVHNRFGNAANFAALKQAARLIKERSKFGPLHLRRPLVNDIGGVAGASAPSHETGEAAQKRRVQRVKSEPFHRVVQIYRAARGNVIAEMEAVLQNKPNTIDGIGTVTGQAFELLTDSLALRHLKPDQFGLVLNVAKVMSDTVMQKAKQFRDKPVPPNVQETAGLEREELSALHGEFAQACDMMTSLKINIHALEGAIRVHEGDVATHSSVSGPFTTQGHRTRRARLEQLKALMEGLPRNAIETTATKLYEKSSVLKHIESFRRFGSF